MKNLKKIAARIAIAFVLITVSVVVFETQTGANKATAEVTLCGVTDTQCINYLLARGYTNVSVRLYNGCHRKCDTSNSYDTWVWVSNGMITGHQNDGGI